MTIAADHRPQGAGGVPAPDGPRRTCVGCRAVRPPCELVRVVRSDDGSLLIGRTLPGRGAWLCRDHLLTCSDHAARKGGFARAFRTKVSVESLSALRRQIDALGT